MWKVFLAEIEFRHGSRPRLPVLSKLEKRFGYPKRQLDYNEVLWRYVDSPQAIPLGKWTHAACSYDGQRIRMYINGALVAEERVPSNVQVNDWNLAIGCKPNKDGSKEALFHGLMSEVSIYGRALSASEFL